MPGRSRGPTRYRFEAEHGDGFFSRGECHLIDMARGVLLKGGGNAR